MRAAFNRSQSVRTSPRFVRVLRLASWAVLFVAWTAPTRTVAAVGSLPPVANSIGVSEDTPPAGNLAPAITGFSTMPYPGNLWVISGTVADENPGGVTVVFGGLLEGTSVSCNADGEFSYVVQFPSGTTGIVTAYAVDENGEVSTTVQDVIDD